MKRRLPFKFVFGMLSAESHGPVAHYGLLVKHSNPGVTAHRFTIRILRPDRRLYDILTDETWIPGTGWVRRED